MKGPKENGLNLQFLPHYVLEELLEFLDEKDLLILSEVNLFFCHKCNEPYVWKNLISTKIQVPENLLNNHYIDTWKMIYFQMNKISKPSGFDCEKQRESSLFISEDKLTCNLSQEFKLGKNQVVFANCPLIASNWKEQEDFSSFLPLTYIEPKFIEENKIIYSVTKRNCVYYELIIEPLESLNNSNSRHPPCIASGICVSDFPYSQSLPGWRDNSFGIHSDDGKQFYEGLSRDYSPVFGNSKNCDVVGVGIDLTASAVFYTLNGKFLGNAALIEKNEYFPVIGIDSYAKVTFNGGNNVPFKFDFDMTPPETHTVVSSRSSRNKLSTLTQVLQDLIQEGRIFDQNLFQQAIDAAGIDPGELDEMDFDEFDELDYDSSDNSLMDEDNSSWESSSDE